VLRSHRVTIALLALTSALSCDGDVLVGQFDVANGGATMTTSTSSVSSGGSASSTTGEAGAGGGCRATACQGRFYLCGNCQDDDMDGLIDSMDPDCLGPCHNSEDAYYGSIPGQSGGNCTKDCYFDQDSGGGNDDCVWNHQCDALEPEPNSCSYDPDTSIGSPPGPCSEAEQRQSDQCLATCMPLVPNGCDCFGCCRIPGADAPVWLGSEKDGVPSCTRGTLDDPESCRPCTQVQACLNPCENCELCVGKTELPPSCDGDTGTPPQECPPNSQACGLVGQETCPQDQYCITGCCILTIK
jgi:hypothetical protein